MSTQTPDARESLRQRRYPRHLFLAYQQHIVDASSGQTAATTPSRPTPARAGGDPNEELTFAAWIRERGTH